MTFYRILSKYKILKKPPGNVGNLRHDFIYPTSLIFSFSSSVRIDQGNYVVSSGMASKSNTKHQHHDKNVWKGIATLLEEIKVDASCPLGFSSKGGSTVQVAAIETLSSICGLLWVCLHLDIFHSLGFFDAYLVKLIAYSNIQQFNSII